MIGAGSFRRTLNLLLLLPAPLLLLSPPPRTIRAGEATYQGKTTGEWIHLPATGDLNARRDAARAIRDLGPAAKDAGKALAEAIREG